MQQEIEGKENADVGNQIFTNRDEKSPFNSTLLLTRLVHYFGPQPSTQPISSYIVYSPIDSEDLRPFPNQND